MDRRLLLAWAFVPAVFYAYACGGDDEAPPAEQDAGSSTSSGGSSSGETSSSGSSSGGSSSGGTNDAGDDASSAACGNPLAEDAGTADGGVVISADGGGVKQIVVSPDSFLDGPQYTDLFDGGALVYSEVFGPIQPRIVRVAADGGVPAQVATTPGNNPNYLLPIGNAIKGTTILTVAVNPGAGNEKAGILQSFADGGSGPKLAVPNAVNDPNDLVVTKGGVIFFTDPAYQTGNTDTGIYRMLGDGGVSAVKTYTGDRPDGIALSPDEKLLYVAFGAAKRIERFTVDANGVTAVANPAAVQATFIDDLEGLAVDATGNLWVAESARATNLDNPPNGGRVEVFTPTGTKLGEVAFPDHRPIAVAFGGTDNKTVFIVTNRNANAGGGGLASYSGQVWTFASRCAGTR